MIKEAKSQEIKEGNQILDIIPRLIKLPQVSTQTGEQNNDDDIMGVCNQQPCRVGSLLRRVRVHVKRLMS